MPFNYDDRSQEIPQACASFNTFGLKRATSDLTSSLASVSCFSLWTVQWSCRCNKWSSKPSSRGRRRV